MRQNETSETTVSKSDPVFREIGMSACFGLKSVCLLVCLFLLFEVLIPREVFEAILCTRYALPIALGRSGKNNGKLGITEMPF